MSSGTQFVKLLTKIQYDQQKYEHGGAFDWLYLQSSIAPVLQFLNENIVEDCTLSDSELRTFATLEGSGRVLSEHELTETMDRSSGTSIDETDLEVLEQDLNALENELRSSELRVRQATKRRDILTSHVQELLDQDSAKEQHYYEKQLSVANNDVEEMNSRLNTCVNELTTTMHSVVHRLCGDNNELPLLSHVDLSEYLQEDQKFLKVLEEYLSKQFHLSTQLGTLKSESVIDRWKLINVSNPESLLVKGESLGAYTVYCNELSRLQQVYSKSHLASITSDIEYTSCKAAVALLSRQCTHDVCASMDQQSLRSKLNDLNHQVSKAKIELESMCTKVLPSELQKMAELQLAPILDVDYSLKLTRQQYHLSKQDGILNGLFHQRARHLMLLSGYECQFKLYEHVKRVLTSGLTSLSAFAIDRKSNHTAGERTLNHSQSSLTYISGHHEFLHRVYNTLSSTQSSSTILSLNALLECVQEFVNTAEANCAHERKNNDACTARSIADMQQNLEKFKSVLPPTTNDSLAPGEFTSEMVTLRRNLEQVHEALNAVLKSKTSKENALRGSHARDKEIGRQLFVHFFLQPSNIDDLMAKIRQQLEN